MTPVSIDIVVNNVTQRTHEGYIKDRERNGIEHLRLLLKLTQGMYSYSMTTKQKKFVRIMVKTGNATEAAAQVYDVANRNVANAIGAENLAKPSIRSALEEHETLFKDTITGTVRDWSKADDTGKRTLATQTAKWGYEQIHGKAVQKSTSVNAHFYTHATEKRKQLGL
jgi:hypothetical protein